MNPAKAAELVFTHANRSKNNTHLTPGELLCALLEGGCQEVCAQRGPLVPGARLERAGRRGRKAAACPCTVWAETWVRAACALVHAQPASVFPALFLQLDVDGDDVVSKVEFFRGFKRFGREAGLRPPKDAESGAPASKSAEEMEAFEADAQKYLAPRVEALKQVFAMLDIGGEGKLNARKLHAFQSVLGAEARKEALAAAAEQGTAVASASPEQAAAFANARLDAKTQALLRLDMAEALAELREASGGKPAGGVTVGYDGEVEVSFSGFRAYLARHAAALAGVAEKGGGKKGKKKK